MPTEVVPMLASLTESPFDNEDWIYEIKWDGYRAVAYCQQNKVELVSRNLKSFTEKYKPVVEALKSAGIKAVLDGEIVAVDAKGDAVFQLLQNWQNNPVHLHFFVFDILWHNGYDVTHLPLMERKKLLQNSIPKNDAVLRYSDHIVGKGKKFFEQAIKQNLEGIMAKKANSIYEPGTRTDNWLKIKVALRQEVVIAGYTEPRNSRQYFGSLLLGLYNGKDLKYIGHTGSGFNTKSLKEIYQKLQPLVTKKSPFAEPLKTNMPATWVAPQLVCEIKFTEWTKDGMARHPIFMGLRVDKKATGVTLEKTIDMAKAAASKKVSTVKKTATKKSTSGVAKKSNPVSALIDWNSGKDQDITLEKQELTLTNGNKPYWKKEGFTKGDTINYYLQIAPFILPYLMNRPQSLNRHPNGIDAPGFFQKDVAGKVPQWMETFEEFSESTGVPVHYLVCNGEASLVYMANLGCIEINPWHSRVATPLKPDWCLIDLDPDKKNTYHEVVEVAQVIKKILEAAGIDSYPKTSGSTGMHIYIPLGAAYSFDDSKTLAQKVVTLTNKELPKLTSIERMPAKRKGQIYLDFLQNKETQTAAAPYSLRPKPGMPVSAPLDWSEVKKGLTAGTYTAYNIFDRLKREGDLFKPVLQKGIDLKAALKKLDAL